LGKRSGAAYLTGLALALAACGPIYQTQYAFTPPPTPEGRVCIMQCEQLRFQCRQNEDLKVQNCENQNRWARAEYERCKRSGRKDCHDGTIWCSSDYDRCDEQYRFCYQSCGGQVLATTVCVANCEKAPPPPVVVQPQAYPPPPPSSQYPPPPPVAP